MDMGKGLIFFDGGSRGRGRGRGEMSKDGGSRQVEASGDADDKVSFAACLS